ncbi:UvrB/UvrC motif-containing protein [Candidatus Kaiserbacteria bacterium]|nr:UvrB/UvrC motif-containing protein [Candidatus Kaiserbacteria bacterium]
MIRRELKKYRLPDGPGVYLFKKGRKILYIGKAASLRDRVRSYFSADLVNGRGQAIVGMVDDATSVSYQKTDSVLEALLLEASLIKRHQPPFNIEQKDNKSWNYVVITKEPARPDDSGRSGGAFPRVLIVRGRELYQGWDKADIKHLFGPFPHGGQLRDAMKMVRRIFPFRDRCTPCDGQLRRTTPHSNSRELEYKDGKVRECKPCFNRQIGLCPGVCSGEMTKEKYAQTIRSIRELFSGNFKGLKRRLAREMKEAVKREDFEEAEKLRRQISALEHVRDVSLIKNEKLVSAGGGTRIEAFDIAHTAGKETVGVMTVLDNGEPYKAAYRKFNVRTATNDDIAALKEVLSRRLNHSEWPLPRVFVVDGGKAQLRAAGIVLKSAGVMIPVVGVVKDEFHRPERVIGDERMIQAHERDILLANNEAHRFAIGFHRARQRKSFGR